MPNNVCSLVAWTSSSSSSSDSSANASMQWYLVGFCFLVELSTASGSFGFNSRMRRYWKRCSNALLKVKLVIVFEPDASDACFNRSLATKSWSSLKNCLPTSVHPLPPLFFRRECVYLGICNMAENMTCKVRHRFAIESEHRARKTYWHRSFVFLCPGSLFLWSSHACLQDMSTSDAWARTNLTQNVCYLYVPFFHVLERFLTSTEAPRWQGPR